jgi:hypothetical protein
MLPDETADTQPPAPDAERAESVDPGGPAAVAAAGDAEAAAAEAQAVTTEVSALARLYGEPLLKLPTDLYIPPDALEIFLEAFEGSAGLAAVPDPQAELQHSRHPDGAGHAAIPEIRRPDPPVQPGTGGRIPADGGDADRDQIAHAAAVRQADR